ncbi:MAG: NADH-quinone oxidoreductase subunit NuoF [Bacillota bacterium]
MIANRQALDDLQAQLKAAQQKIKARILICAGTGCVANGSLKVYEELKRLVKDKGAYVGVDLLLEGQEGVAVAHSGCHGFCEKGPLVRIEPADILYTKVKLEDAEEIVASVMDGHVIDRLLYKHPVTGETHAKEHEIPFYEKQTRVGLKHCGHVDPDDIREYIADQGYQAIAKALHDMNPDSVVEEVLASGLRGRGGAGFPTGRKWQLTKKSPGPKKYVVCNGDEGDPGAFMDRSVMEGDPHRVIEAMMIAAFAIGADEGYIYVRAEYPLAVKRLRNAIDQAERCGLLGENILDTGFNFTLHIKEGAGAFVCGEETALLASIEGQRGTPRPRPPFPADKGLWQKPTLINNVETYANIPQIILKGAQWFASMGMEKSRGTKVFALTGQVANTGLIEVPMGTTLRQVVFDIGGGIRGGGKFKAVQIGGPSGACLTEQHLDLPLDYDSLASVGAMIGSGGLVVMDETTCMVETARFFLEFTCRESCGKCPPCRVGTRRMLQILERITRGEGEEADIAKLESLASGMKAGSLCGLGQTASNPVVSTLRYFRDEYEAHIKEKRCPAKVCKSLVHVTIDPDTCRGCSLCKKACPVNAISGTVKQAHSIDPDVCIKCRACVAKCPFHAIS